MKFDSREEMQNYNREEMEVIAVGKGEVGSKSANCSLLLEAPLYYRVDITES